MNSNTRTEHFDFAIPSIIEFVKSMSFLISEKIDNTLAIEVTGS